MKKSSDANTSSKESNVGSSKSQTSSVPFSFKKRDVRSSSIPNGGVVTDDEYTEFRHNSKMSDALAVANEDESKKLPDNSKIPDALSVANEDELNKLPDNSKKSDALSVANEDESKKLPDNSKIPDVLYVVNEDEFNKLPDKYQILDYFFGRLCSIFSLCCLTRRTPTFTAIRSGIEYFTKMKFTLTHLAQLKYILPEAIVLEEQIVFVNIISERDINISLNPDAVKADLDAEEAEEAKLLSRSRILRKVFRARLRDFWKSHPQGDEIPEGTLSERFNRHEEAMLGPLPRALPRFLLDFNDIVAKFNAEYAKSESESAKLGESVELPIEDLAAPSDTPSLRADDVELPIEDLAAPSDTPSLRADDVQTIKK